MQHRTAVTQARDTKTIEQMGVDSCDLRSNVGAYAQRAPGQLVYQFESLQVKRFTGTTQQGVEVLQQRRNHQFITITSGGIHQFPPEFFDMACLGGQHIGYVIRQEPGRHEQSGLLKT